MTTVWTWTASGRRPGYLMGKAPWQELGSRVLLSLRSLGSPPAPQVCPWRKALSRPRGRGAGSRSGAVHSVSPTADTRSHQVLFTPIHTTGS